ncbi:MAG: hypothetical protein IJU58_01035 [Clostridia bacterium]|nr:hypothetical protein [Clostridia bacterium]
MHIFIEGKEQYINTKQIVISQNFDIYKNQYTCEVVTKQIINTPIYHYADFDLMICPIKKTQKASMRFVLYNIRKQISFVLFEIDSCDSVQIFRLNKFCFIVLCTTINNTIMHNINIKNKEPKSKKVELNKVHQVGFANREYVLINSTKQYSNKYVHSIMLYNSEEDVLQIVYSLQSKYYAHIRYDYKDYELNVFDVHSSKILYNCKLKK